MVHISVIENSKNQLFDNTVNQAVYHNNHMRSANKILSFNNKIKFIKP